MLGLLPILAGLISLILAAMVMVSGASTKSSKWSFFGFATSVGVWAIGVGIFIVTDNQFIADIAVHTYYIAALFIAYSLMIFSLSYGPEKIPKSIVVLGLLPLALAAIAIYPFRLLVGSVDTSDHSVILDSGAYILYVLIFIVYATVAMSALWYKTVRNKRKHHYRLLAIALTVCLIGGGFFNLVLPGLGYYQYVVLGPLFTFVMVAAVFYAIVRHGLFDIRLAVVRTVTYLLSLATLAGIYLVVTYLLFGLLFGQFTSSGQLILNTVLTISLAFVFQPIRRFFDRFTNKLFYRDNYNADDFFAELSRELTSTSDLHELLVRVASKIAKTIKLADVSFVVYTSESHSIQAGVGDFKHVSFQDAQWLHKELENSDMDAIVTADLDTDFESVRRMLVGYHMSGVLPLIRQGVLIGYLFLGVHERQGYSHRDIRVLETLAGELVIAIQNALAVEEVKKINGHLEQRISSATKELRASNVQLQRLDQVKDDFISMASHQLRTPLTSIKGYLSMLIDGDVGEVTNDQKHVLNEAFVSSERMVRLIGDFLNVSRLQTGKFVIEKRPIDLALVVQREVEGLVSNAAARGMKFIYKKPKNIPILELDENKIQQVIMNFCDNAIYYSKDKDKITVTLKKMPGYVEFTVKDNGIGVPKSEQENLFNKFFRATNARKARPDGTGVGLFLAKKVIDDHDGEIVFSSVEGKGSTFGFRVPIQKNVKK